MDRDTLIADLETYWPGYRLLVRVKRPVQQRAPDQLVRDAELPHVATANSGSDLTRKTARVTSLVASFQERDSEEFLVISCATEDRETFTLLLSESQLPISDSETRATFGVERSTAAELLVWLEETTFRHTAEELDGRLVSDV